MFGQTGNSSFGFNTSTQNNPFGQSAFGKPIATTSFGTGGTPVFGSGTPLFSSKPAGPATGGLFSSAAQTPGFGQPATTQSSFGAFGNTSTNTNLFGTQPNAANPFGANQNTSVFGQTSKPNTFTMPYSSTGTSLFGQTPQATQQATPFGQPNATATTSLFGNTGGFGASNTQTGTVVKFNPVTGTDTMLKNGVTITISTRHHCITCMKEYEGKSLEELRWEDYNAGRKGSTGGQTGIFGSTTQTTPFGQPAAGATQSTGFGAIGTGFGATSQAGTTGLFSKPLTSFGQPATTTSAFAFNTTTTPTLFGNASQAKPFGATAAPLFSNSGTSQAGTTGFGTMNTAQTTGFSAFGQAPANQSIGLFNQSKPAFSLPASTTTTGFGAFNSTTNTGTGLFGQNKPATATGAFGATPGFGTSQPSAFGTTSAFGANQTNTGLFNSPFKPAGSTSGFSFGNNTGQTTGLGTGTGLLGGGSSLFGQQKPGGLFSNTGNTSAFNTAGGFGTGSFGANTSTMPSLGMGLLGGGLGSNASQQTSGSVPVHQQILNLVSAPFGDSPLLKNLLPASGKTEELLKPTNAAAKNLNSTQFKISTNSNSPKVKAKAMTASQLSKKSLFDGLEEEDPNLSEAFQPRPNAKRLVLRPKSATNLSSQSVADETIGSIKNLNESGNIASPEGIKSPNLEATNKENENLELRVPGQDRRSSSAWLKTAPMRKNKDDDDGNQQSPFRGAEIPEEQLENTLAELRPTSSKPNLSHQLTSGLSSPNSTLNIDRSIADSIGRESDSYQELDETSTSTYVPDDVANAAKVKLTRVGYYTIPPLNKLDEYVRGETCVVPHFTVGRKGYGNVYFPESFDIYGLDLDEIVHFRHKEVIIYPEDDKKPPINQGLNRKAQVTLDRVWPLDRSLHTPITDPHRLQEMNYEGKLKRVSERHDTRFLEYRPETGSWVFKVDHFSKYGLSDSDDEDTEVPNNVDIKKIKTNNIPPKVNKNRVSSSFTKEKIAELAGLSGVIEDKTHKFPMRTSDSAPRMFEDDIHQIIFLDMPSSDYTRDTASALSPTSVYARIFGADSHKVQLMKASFFDADGDDIITDRYIGTDAVVERMRRLTPDDRHMYEDDDFMDDPRLLPIKPITPSRYHVKLQTDVSALDKNYLRDSEDLERIQSFEGGVLRASTGLSKLYLPPIIPTPLTVVTKSNCEVIPLKDSVISRLRSRCIADTGIQMGRKFRPSWGPGLTLVSLNTKEQASQIPLQSNVSQLGQYLCGRLTEDNTSMSIIQRLQILGGRKSDCDYGQDFNESIEGHLRIQLDHCSIGYEKDVPILEIEKGKKGIAALQAHCNLARSLVDPKDPYTLYFSNVWKLCDALWGDNHDLEDNDDKDSHQYVMVRKEALSNWLREVVDDKVQEEVAELDSEERQILSLLSANKLEKACEIARKSGDYCLALFMSQLGGTTATREVVKQQIALWQDTQADLNLSIDRLKLFMFAAGVPLICSKQGVINICAGFDWKRALAIHLWYLATPVASISDVMELFEASFNTNPDEAYSAEPRPEYFNDDYETEMNGKNVYDLCFHLLKLYCTGSHSLEVLLNPMTHTADPLDYRLSWLMQQTLVALGYTYISDSTLILTHGNFAAQLETYGMWHWAIFVWLHLRDVDKRRHAVTEILSRHVQLSDEPDYVKREDFLKEELGIPSIWINKAKAIKACAMKKFGEAAWYLIQAEEWNRAHQVIIEHLAADAVINENYDYLKSLIRFLVPEECSRTINGWAHQGQLLWDYMCVTSEIQSLLETPDNEGIGYKLEGLKPQLTSLCTKIHQFPCPSAKHRLCQAEISKRTLQLARNLLMLESNDRSTTSNVLLKLIVQLPLPEDYTQQELLSIVNSEISEFVIQ